MEREREVKLVLEAEQSTGGQGEATHGECVRSRAGTGKQGDMKQRCMCEMQSA